MRGGSLTVPVETIARWGVSHEAAFQRAKENDDHDARRPWLTSPERPGLFRSPWQDTRDGGRMINPRTFGMPLRGRPVVMLPKPSMALMAGSEDAVGLVHLAEVTRREVEAWGRVFVLRAFRMGADGESWEDWMPAPSHRAYPTLRLLQAQQERREYGEQADLVDALARAKGTDAMPLPRLEVLHPAVAGEAMTVTTWRSGRPTALPKADPIVLKRGAKTLGLALWDDLVRALPGVFERGPGQPTRYIALDFPEDWQLAEVDLRPWREGPA